LIRHVMKDRDFVVLNADETCLSNMTSWTHGTFITRIRSKRISEGSAPVAKRQARLTLLAAISDDAAMQSKLPQICLPHTAAGRSPNAEQLDMYAAMEKPMEVWYGSKGWVTALIFMRWLTHVRRTVHAHRPGAWLVLLIDCSPIHLCLKVLQHCRRLGILLLFVPARTTWLLQPLDVQVFSRLKRNLSKRHQEARLQSPGGVLEESTQWENVDVAVGQEVLQRDWAKVFARCGCGQSLAELAHGIGALLGSENLKARPPSREEMAELLGRRLSPGSAKLGDEILHWQSSLLTRHVSERPPTWSFGMRDASSMHARVAVPRGQSASFSDVMQAPPAMATVRAVRLILPPDPAVQRPAKRPRIGPSAGTRSQS
jgi:hypothetical protein